MKVYTITCHDVYNYGASLQAYALMKYITDCGFQTEIIDYKPAYLSNHYQLFTINHPKWEKNMLTKMIYLGYKLPGRVMGLRRKRAFDHFTATYLPLTKERFTSNMELKERLPKADIYICGSDQIWNSVFENGRDPAFYLDFAPIYKRKAAFAASFATDELPATTIPFVKEKLQKLDAISVREKSGQTILENIGIKNAAHVIDPVLLLPKKEWNQIAKKSYKEKYILVYDFDQSPLIKKMAMELSKRTNWKIFSVHPGPCKYADKQFKHVGPDTFLSLLKGATFVLSNSFHAAVFSVMYQKNFAIVNRRESINTRMRDFLDDLGLHRRLVDTHYKLEELLIPIQYDNKENALQEKITLSKQFLQDVLYGPKTMRHTL